MRANRVGPEAEGNVASNLSRFECWAKRLAGTATWRKRTEITVETDQLLVIRRWRSRRSWCPVCGREVEVVGVEEAVAITGVREPLLAGIAGDRRWHCCEAPDGSARICLDSVLNSL
jgi:hypothetical protein